MKNFAGLALAAGDAVPNEPYMIINIKKCSVFTG